ncbi:MAG: amidase [Candidatus Binatota bacterium]|nr:amidase [Candidatus Binatota bacterium]
MKNSELCFTSLTEVARRIEKRELSPVEVTRALLERIDALEPTLHSYLTVLHDRALGQAREAEREIQSGRYRGPLHGVPIAVKDLCWTKGIATTCASKVLRDWRPDEDAAVVEKLEQAGAVIAGKLNLTEFAVTWYHPELPVPRNPWNLERWPGASSSGSGVATAAGLCFGSLGTDTGGSIRFPSASCGIVGLKPTYGRVSRYGVFPLGESLDHVGPMTRTVADAAAMLEVIAGFDPRDATSCRDSVPRYRDALGRGVRGIRVGFDEGYVSEGTAPEVAASVRDAVRLLEKQGAEIVDIHLPDVRETLTAWISICAPETAAAHERTFPSRADDYGPGFRSFLELGTRIAATDYAKAHRVREHFTGALAAVWDEVQVIACPSMPMLPPPADSFAATVSDWGDVAPVLKYTAPFNLSRNPTLSVPCGFAEGLPISLQLVAPHFDETILCRVGDAYQSATEWHERHPSVASPQDLRTTR